MRDRHGTAAASLQAKQKTSQLLSGVQVTHYSQALDMISLLPGQEGVAAAAAQLWAPSMRAVRYRPSQNAMTWGSAQTINDLQVAIPRLARPQQDVFVWSTDQLQECQ